VFPLGEFLSSRVFYPQVVDQTSSWPTSLEFFPPHDFLQSGGRRSDGLISLVTLFRNIVNDHARQCRKFRGISSSLDRFFLIN
jgi:hypothetical protein